MLMRMLMQMSMSMLVYIDAHDDIGVHAQVCVVMDVDVGVAADVE